MTSAPWHADAELLAAYSSGAPLDDALAWSLEAHLAACPGCRARQRALADPAALDRIRTGLEAAIDLPRRGIVERGLILAGVPGDVARLLAATPALRLSWLGAVTAALAAATAASAVATSEGGAPLWLLIVAPLLPLAGIAAAYGPGIDPTYEIGLTAPMRSFRLLLLRAAAVLGTTVALATVASLALTGLSPGRAGLAAAGWLLPALALTLASLALATVVEPLYATALLAGGWLVAIWLTSDAAASTSALLGAPGQAGCAAVAALAAAVLALRRRRLDTDRRFDPSPRFSSRRLS